MFLILSFCFYCFNKWCRHRLKFIYWVNGTTKLKFGKLVVKMNLRVGLSDAHRFSFSSDHSWSSEALAADTDALSDDLHLWEYMTVKHRGGWSSTCNCLMSCVYIYISCNCLLFCFFIFSLQRLTLLHVNSNQCLDMPSEDDKMVPTLRDCNGSRSQQWLLRNMTLSVWLVTSVLCRSPPNQSWLTLTRWLLPHIMHLLLLHPGQEMQRTGQQRLFFHLIVLQFNTGLRINCTGTCISKNMMSCSFGNFYRSELG